MSYIQCKRSYKDYFLLKFSDEEFEVNWKIGNLSRFFRNLWEDNVILRKGWKGVRENKFHFSKQLMYNAGSALLRAKKKGFDEAVIHFLPMTHEKYHEYTAIVKRLGPKSAKLL